jgi:hypothetical protein
MTKIGKWEIPTKLFDDYIRFSIMADSYLMRTLETPSNTDYERRMRWSMCVSQLIKIHREICESLKIEYSEEPEDEFYSMFHREIEKQKRLKG